MYSFMYVFLSMVQLTQYPTNCIFPIVNNVILFLFDKFFWFFNFEYKSHGILFVFQIILTNSCVRVWFWFENSLKLVNLKRVYRCEVLKINRFVVRTVMYLWKLYNDTLLDLLLHTSNGCFEVIACLNGYGIQQQCNVNRIKKKKKR